MQIFLFMLVLTLIVINVRQAGELRDLERKTLDAFKIVCRNFEKIEGDE